MCCRVFYAYKVKRCNLQSLHKERCKVAMPTTEIINALPNLLINKTVTNKHYRLVHTLIVTATELIMYIIYNFKPAHFIY